MGSGTSGPKASNLSSPKYGYDFVVSTTQASINSGLLAYLSQGNQPIEYICFLADPQTGKPREQITLKDLLIRTGNVNPFDIPDNTSYEDSRITVLTRALFAVGIKMQMGLPPGVLPKDLPMVINLGNSAKDVMFNLFCSQFSVIQNSPPSNLGEKGQWNVWSQAAGKPWNVQARVNLVVADLDKELDTPYFNNHPDIKNQLNRQLMNTSASAFSLQQLMFDLDNAVLHCVPTFQGIPDGSNAETILQKSFLSIYSQTAKLFGLPLVSVIAVAHSPDPSQLQMTGFELQVNHLKDDKGIVIPNPTSLEQSATTLDYLCAANNHPLPGASSFSWNWVLLKDIDNESGIISINRNVIGNYIMNQILPFCKASCIMTWCGVEAEFFGKVKYSSKLTPGQTPDIAIITPTGVDVVRIEYLNSSSKGNTSGLTYGELRLSSSYKCDVSFVSNTIVVKQHLILHIFVQWDNTPVEINAFDKTITETYTISVDQNGDLLLKKTGFTTDDKSQDPDRSWFINALTGINDIMNNIKANVTNFVTTRLHEIKFDHLQKFVFPGAKVFTYKSAGFSEYQDLVCDISYVDPRKTVTPASMAKKPSSTMLSLAATNTGPTLALKHSSEMMQNYIQGEIVPPTSKFESLQTNDGHALLFAIDSSGVFHVIEEQSGKTSTGWQLSDLSTAAIKTNFPNGTNAIVRTFDVGQSAVDGSIGIAMSISFGGTDNLFVSLYNSSSDTSWTAKLNWTAIPFDAVAERPPTITIAGILFAETIENQQYLIVDIDRSAKSSVKDIMRYYIDPSKSTGSFWVKHDVPVDIEDGSYQSCVGRVSNGRVDGVYTSGMAEGAPQLVYVPVMNVFGAGPPLTRRCSLPGRALPSSIATARNGDKSSSLFATTDLYAVSGLTLYRFAADAQNDGDIAKPLVTSELFSGTDSLMAMMHDGVMTLWGKNGSDQVYYLSCPTTQLALPGSWSTPVPILTGIERISAYVNMADGGNTIFASGGGKLKKLIQATGTTGRMWRTQEIKLAIPTHQKSLSFNSYTTTLQVTDVNDLPASGVMLEISADSRTPVYINGLYYVLGKAPVNVVTNAAGSVTVIEATEDINGAILVVSMHGGVTSTVINPMDKSFEKLANLNTEDSLRGASFPTHTKAGGVVGPTDYTPLVARSTTQSDIKTVSANISKLKMVYSDVQAATLALAALNRRVVPSNLLLDIAISAGDMFLCLKSGAEAVINFVLDAVSGALYFIATIAGKVYSAVLDSVEAVVGAVEWVFNAIKTGIEDIIHFVEFLFEWDDIRRTKDVMHNVVKLYLLDQVDGIQSAKVAFDGQIAAVEQTLNKWAGITDWSPLGTPATKAAIGSTSNPAQGQTSGSQLLAGHFQNHARDLTIVGDNPSFDVVQKLVDDLLTAISNEGEVLSAVYGQLQKLASTFSSMSVGDAIKALATILADGVLSSVQVVVDALLDVLRDLASSAIGLLDAKVHIPIISDILNAIGIPDISFLDLFTWISAVGYTVVYKIVNNEAPFTDDDNVKAIISASSWDNLAALFQPQAPHPVSLTSTKSTELHSFTVNASPRTLAMVSLSKEQQNGIFIAGHAVAGFMLFNGNFLSAFEAEAETGDNDFSIPSAILGVIVACSQGAADFLVPKYPIEYTVMKGISYASTAAVLIAKLVFSGPVQAKFGAQDNIISTLAVKDGRAMGAIVNSFLVIPQLFVTGYHFYELSAKPKGAERSAAILGEVSNLTSYVSRISYAVAVIDKDPASRQVAIATMVASNLASSGLQLAEALIH